MPRPKKPSAEQTTKVTLYRVDRQKLADLSIPGEATADTLGRLLDWHIRHLHLDPVYALRNGGQR